MRTKLVSLAFIAMVAAAAAGLWMSMQNALENLSELIQY
jgi:hypothetical protein